MLQFSAQAFVITCKLPQELFIMYIKSLTKEKVDTQSIFLAFVIMCIPARIVSVPVNFMNTEDVCNSQECRDAARKILDAMDITADPCNDFHQFACGGWIKRHPIPDDRPDINQFALATTRLEQQLRDVLLSNYSNERDSIRKAEMFYASCIKEDTSSSSGIIPVMEFVQELGGMPLMTEENDESRSTTQDELHFENLLGTTRYSIDVSPIINLDIRSDDMNSSQNIIVLDQPNLIMPAIGYYLRPDYEYARESYVQFLTDFFRELLKHTGQTSRTIDLQSMQLERRVVEILQLEIDLAKIHTPDEHRVDILHKYNKMAIRDISTQLSPEFNWLHYINTTMEKINSKVQHDTEVVIYSRRYFEKLLQVLRRHRTSVIRNYVVAFSLINHINAMPKILRDTERGFRKSITGESVESAQWKKCVRRTRNLFKMPVAALYVRHFFSEKSKFAVNEMTDYIISTFKDSLRDNEWMDRETKGAALEKVDQVYKLIGYPNYISDETDPLLDEEYNELEILEDQYFKNEIAIHKMYFLRSLKKVNGKVKDYTGGIGPAEVNAFYSRSSNMMVFPAGILQPPFYDEFRPFAVNYGAIGNAIGHEITHGFDISGSRYDGNGNLVNWWTNSSRDRFENEAQCLKEQFSSFFYEAAGMLVNGNRTIRENIADNIGIKVAFNAYRLWKGSNPGLEFSLPEFEHYTPEQMFFIATGQMWCSSERRNFARMIVMKYSHTPPIIRLQGMLTNFEEFGAAFSCEKGKDLLYPPDQDVCRLW